MQVREVVRLPELEEDLCLDFHVSFHIATITENTITDVTCLRVFGMNAFEVPI